MRTLALMCVALLLAGCPGGGSNDGGTDGGGGGGGNNSMADFALETLDPNARETVWHAMAVEPNTRRIGVAYFTPRGTMMNAGVPDYELKYLEWRDGVVTGPETIRVVQRTVGLSLAFQPVTGEPAIGLLGGDDTFVPGMSIFWFQSDAVVVTRANGTWTQNVIATNGGQVTCGNPVSDRGLLVGLWPALVFDGNGAMVFAWRDGHDTNLMDWQGSDVESAEGSITAPTLKCVNAGGNGGTLGMKPAWGGRIQLAVGANGQPAMVYDRAQLGADTIGDGAWFQQRNAAGAWSISVSPLSSSDTQTGVSLAWDSMEGWGITAVDGVSGGLHYVHSANGTTWTAADAVFAAGSGGWYPSLAMDTTFHEPNIAFYVCDTRDGTAPTECPESKDELRVARRVSSGWREQVVDIAGGWLPKLGFFGTGKRFIVYRDPRSGVLKLATER